MQKKHLTKFSDHLWKKTLNKVVIEGTYFNIIKTICDKLTANMIFNGENLKAVTLRSEKKHGCPYLPLLLNTVLATSIRQEMEIKGIQNRKEKYNCHYLQWNDTIYRKPKKLLEWINIFIKVTGHNWYTDICWISIY